MEALHSGDTVGEEESLSKKIRTSCWISGCVLELCCKRRVEEKKALCTWYKIKLKPSKTFSFSLSKKGSITIVIKTKFLLFIYLIL